ncbi:MAG: winged helix-turn-helix transcriptional regulator [Candidatus Neomarinimicrobiota bacterium]|tara:strand:+ start:24 stop:458 length:435 start_codon:yes stop_codon:yes gene_type:complete
MVKTNNLKIRSKCPLSCSLDIFGDKWSLLILRDMIFEKKNTFKDFISSEEKIASNILSSRLKKLEKFGLISKNSNIQNRKTKIYKLTDSGLELIPTILEITIWGKNNIKIFNQKYQNLLDSIKNKQKLIEKLQHEYLESFNKTL